MPYVAARRRMRRLPGRLAGAHSPVSLGFAWGNFFTEVTKATAPIAAAAGISRIGQASAPKPAAPPATALPASLSEIPIWAWALGGMGFLLVLVMTMRR